MVMYRVAGVKS